MKEKRSVFIRFVFGVSCIVCILLYACANEEFISNDLPTNGVTFGKNDVLTLDAAKTWFSENSLPVCEMRATDNSQGFLVRPSWNHAKEWKKGKFEVVEASLITQTSIIFYDDETSKNANWKNDSKKIKNVGRMVFLTDLETGKTRNFLMIIVGSYEYLMKKDNKLSKNNYLYREPKFDGNILFYKPDGGFINGWKYENGKITHKISPGNNDSSLPSLTRSTECYYEYINYAYNACPDIMNTAEFGGVTGNITTGGTIPEVFVNDCSWQYGVICLKICTYIDDGNGNGGNGGSGGNNGTTPGGVNPEEPPHVIYSATITGNCFVNILENFSLHTTITPSATAINIRFEIAHDGQLDEQKWILQEDISNYCLNVKSLRPGNWDVRAVVTLPDTVITSNILDVEVLFPDRETIKNDYLVSSNMDAVWQETKDAASESGRSERGFWIYLNTGTESYEIGPTIPGPNITGCINTHGEINPGSPTLENPSISPIEGGTYYVAFFHTHTPLTYCTYDPISQLLPTRHPVGPSDSDISYALENGLPGIVYDYVGVYLNFAGENGIEGGHNIDADVDIYLFGTFRRNTLLY